MLNPMSLCLMQSEAEDAQGRTRLDRDLGRGHCDGLSVPLAAGLIAIGLLALASALACTHFAGLGPPAAARRLPLLGRMEHVSVGLVRLWRRPLGAGLLGAVMADQGPQLLGGRLRRLHAHGQAHHSWLDLQQRWQLWPSIMRITIELRALTGAGTAVNSPRSSGAGCNAQA